jgi:hypothetical protein
MTRMAFVALASCALAVALTGEAVPQELGGRPTLPNFCMGWERVCLRNCPAGDCTERCAQRRATCNKTGVFHFNAPGPRRYSSCEDRGLVISASGKMFRDIPGWKCR